MKVANQLLELVFQFSFFSDQRLPYGIHLYTGSTERVVIAFSRLIVQCCYIDFIPQGLKTTIFPPYSINQDGFKCFVPENSF